MNSACSSSFSGALSPEKRMALLTDQLKQHEEKLAHLKGNMGKFSSIPPEDENDFADYLVLHGAVFKGRNKLQMVKRLYQVMQKRSVVFATLLNLYSPPAENDDR